MKHQSFHLALPCRNIEETKKFYLNILGAKLGRNSDQWIDIDLYNNQITFTASGKFDFSFNNYRLGKYVLPSFHFGIIMETNTWNKLYRGLNDSKLNIVKEFTVFKDKAGEHRSFFVKDPNGYLVEFKNFKSKDEIFLT